MIVDTINIINNDGLVIIKMIMVSIKIMIMLLFVPVVKHEVVGVVGAVVAVPYNCTPSYALPGDRPALILWYKDRAKLPIYRYTASYTVNRIGCRGCTKNGNPPGSAVNTNFPTSICPGRYVNQRCHNSWKMI